MASPTDRRERSSTAITCEHDGAEQRDRREPFEVEARHQAESDGDGERDHPHERRLRIGPRAEPPRADAELDARLPDRRVDEHDQCPGRDDRDPPRRDEIAWLERASAEAAAGGGSDSPTGPRCGSASVTDMTVRRRAAAAAAWPRLTDTLTDRAPITRGAPRHDRAVRQALDLLSDVERGGVHRARPRRRPSRRATCWSGAARSPTTS